MVLITGVNQGIGFETAKTLLLSSPTYHILLSSRSLAKASTAISTLQALPIKGTVSPLQIDPCIDILVNNAGTFSHNPSVRDAAREIFAVNTIGAISVTEAFLPLLRKSSNPRLIFVSSSLGSISQAADPSSKYYNPAGTEYRASKAALNMLMVQYWAKLGKDGFTVFGADPGLVATNFTDDPDALRKRGGVEPEVGGERIANVVKGERDADVGRVCGEYGVSPW